MMSSPRCSRRELEERLSRAEALITALKTGEVDAVVGCGDISFVRSRRIDEERRSFNAALEERVAERTRQLRALTVALTNAEHRERRRLARVLHDEVQPLIVGAKIWLSMLQEDADDDTRQMLSKVDALLSKSVEATRSLSGAISPPNLFESGLGPAVEWLCKHMRELHGLSVALQVEDDGQPALESLRVLLYEAVRELLFNVVKHGNTGFARVTITRQPPGVLQVDVHDNGAGFDMDDGPTHGGTGFGLFSIRERLEAVGGAMEVASAPGRGTTVTLRVSMDSDSP